MACYLDEKEIPTIGEKYLNTSSWKDSIINDITLVQGKLYQMNMVSRQYLKREKFCNGNVLMLVK